MHSFIKSLAAAAAVAENTQPIPELLPQDIEGGTAAIKDFHAHFHLRGIINHKSIKMKKTLFLFSLLIGLSVSAQEGEMRINMWYGTINNSDVEEHLALEKHFKSVWKQQRDAGLLINWEMWQLINPHEASTETTYLYTKFYTEENRKKSANISGIPEGLDAETWEVINKKQLSHFTKIYSTDVSYKGGFNNSVEGSKPSDYAVINSMSVDWYRQAEYESMELKTFMPINQKNGCLDVVPPCIPFILTPVY